MVDQNAAPPTKLSFGRWMQVMLLSLYCAVAVLGPLLYLILSFDQLFAESDTNRQQVFVATILTGVLGSALRGMSNLFSDVGKGRYQPSWNLSILMRPLEGAGIALVSYLAITAGLVLLEQGRPTPNPSGYLFVGVLSGMFSHRAADALRKRFDEIWGSRGADGPSSPL